MIRVLLLTCGTNASFHIARVLKEKFSDDFYLIGTDINKPHLVSAKAFLDEFYQSPYSKESGYYTFILDLCRNRRIDWIIPVFDSDQFLFPCDSLDLAELNVKSFGISKDAVFYKDKVSTNEYMASCGIPVPKTYKLQEVQDAASYFIKPLNGSGSVGARSVRGEEIKSVQDIGRYLIQEVCVEPEFTLECFYYGKRIYSVCRERIESKSGVCTKARVFQNKGMEEFARRLSHETDLPHVFNMQFMKNAEGKYVCTDLNLRAAGGMSLSYAAGWDEVSSLANIMLGKSGAEITASVDRMVPEQYVVRHYEDSVTKIVKTRIAFDLDGTLLDSRKRHEIVMADVLKEEGLRIDVSNLVSFKSGGKNNIAWLSEKGVPGNQAKEINEKWVSLIENETYLKSDVLYPGAETLLKDLSKENNLYLITARNNRENALGQIKDLGIAQYFTDVIVVPSCRESARLKAMELLKNEVSCFVGDTESDYEAAKIAGCEFKAVSNGFRDEKFWSSKNMKSYKNVSQIPYIDAGGGYNCRVVFAKLSFLRYGKGAVA